MFRSSNPWIPTEEKTINAWNIISMLLMGYGAYCLISKVGKSVGRFLTRPVVVKEIAPVHDDYEGE